jgi:hypothetical protein
MKLESIKLFNNNNIKKKVHKNKWMVDVLILIFFQLKIVLPVKQGV